ncbi:MAG: P-loop NTPase fold protein [Candidatus Woesearchaeota archaeon]
MWSDGVPEIDMLAYEPYAELVFEIATSERLTPLTLGLFGNWGSGKSTLLDLIDRKIKENNQDENKVVSIIVNAWMYEGYEDAKVALMDSVIRTIMEEKEIKDRCIDGFKSLLKKIDWMRVGTTVAKKGVPLAISAATGNPMPALASIIPELKNIDESEIEDYSNKIKKLNDFIKKDSSEKQGNIVENIRTFRKDFEKLLKESSIDNLIIMVDDLDRCAPERIIETLEAIKLFLSVENTTFIIAIDQDVVRYSIKRKYPKLNDLEEIDISDDYIEKIIQFPIKIPELSEIDIKNYMLLLICERFIKNHSLKDLIEHLKDENIFIRGEIISVNDIKANIEDGINIYKSNSTQDDFNKYLELFNKIADIISYTLKGNPRQTKRFLNTYFLRKRLSEIQGIDLNASILAKLMVLEYTNKRLFKKVYNWQFQNKGIASELGKIQRVILEEDEEAKSKFDDQWFSSEMKNWFALDPVDLHEKDLRQYFYLAKESVSEKESSILNLGAEIRRKIKDICKEGLDEEIRRKKIEDLQLETQDDRNEIIETIINKFNQEKERYKFILLIILKYYPEYSEKIINQLKKLNKKEIDPGFLFKLKSFNQEPQKRIIEDLKKYYVEKNIIPENMIDKIENW